MRLMHVLIVLVGLGLSPLVARAACDSPYDSGQLLDDLVMVEDALRNSDGATALQVADKIEAGFACLSEPLPYMVAARVYRAVGAGKVLGGEEARGKEWFLTALELDPTFEYGLEDVPADSPVRFAFESLRGEAEASPESLEADFVDGTHYLDGSLLGSPRATPGRPHVYQHEGDPFESWVIEGTAFPDDVLAAAVADAEEPEPDEAQGSQRDRKKKRDRRKKKADPGDDVDQAGFYERKRPPEKTPLMIGGSTLIAGAGVVYYLSSTTRRQFDESTTVDAAKQYRTQTNRLVLISGAVLAAGAGTLTWGIMLDGGTPLPGIHLKF